MVIMSCPCCMEMLRVPTKQMRLVSHYWDTQNFKLSAQCFPIKIWIMYMVNNMKPTNLDRFLP